MEIPTQSESSSVASQQKNSNAKSVIITILILVGAFIGIGVWYNNTHYNSSFENNFLASCEAQGASASACSCSYGQLQQQYSYSQAKYFNANPNAPDTQTAFNAIASQCTGSSQGQ